MSDTPTTREIWWACVTAAMSGDVAAQAEHYHDDAVLEFPFLIGDGLPNRFEGRRRIAQAFTTFGEAAARSGARVDQRASSCTVHETTDPEVIVAEIELVRTLGSGEPMLNRYIQVIRATDGKVASMRDYFAGNVTEIVTASPPA